MSHTIITASAAQAVDSELSHLYFRTAHALSGADHDEAGATKTKAPGRQPTGLSEQTTQQSQSLHSTGEPTPAPRDRPQTPRLLSRRSTALEPIAVVARKDEARVDSRLLAQHLGNQHENVMRLLRDYRTDFELLGILRFQTGEITGRGQPAKFAFLNEDQAYLLLAYSRNTAKVRALKVKLVLAFREARRAAELHAEYLPTYHALHDQVHALAGGSPNERFAHINFNKLVNKAAGAESGQRASLDVPSKAMLIAAQHIAAQAMQGAEDHHDGYAKAKAALAPLLIGAEVQQ